MVHAHTLSPGNLSCPPPGQSLFPVLPGRPPCRRRARSNAILYLPPWPTDRRAGVAAPAPTPTRQTSVSFLPPGTHTLREPLSLAAWIADYIDRRCRQQAELTLTAPPSASTRVPCLRPVSYGPSLATGRSAATVPRPPEWPCWQLRRLLLPILATAPSPCLSPSPLAAP